MQDSAPPPAVSTESLARKHEARDPWLAPLWIIVSSVLLMLAVCLAASGVMIRHFATERPMQAMQPLGILTAPNLKPLERFPQPNLTIDDDHAQMAALRARQIEQLNSYGWIDRSNGIVRIPIARAMDLVLQRGLPTRANGSAPTDDAPLQWMPETTKRP